MTKIRMMDQKEEGSKGPASIVQSLLKTYGGPLGTIPAAVTAAIFISSPSLTPNRRFLKTIQGVRGKERVGGGLPLFRFSKRLR